MIVNSISYAQPINNIQKQNRIQNRNNNKFISFKAGLTTLKEKSDIFVPKISDYIKNAKIITFDGLNTILHMVVNNVNIEDLTSNVKKTFNLENNSDSFVQTKMQYNAIANKMNPNIKRTIYLELPQNVSTLKCPNSDTFEDDQFQRASLLDRTVHEVVHTFQDNSSDRLSLAGLLTKFFEKDNPISIRKDTYFATFDVFEYVENYLLNTLNIVRPYIKNNPKKDTLENIEDAYNKYLNTSLVPNITEAINNALIKCKTKYPNCDLIQLMITIHYMIQCEIEAYSAGINAVLKTFPSDDELISYYPEVLKYAQFLMERGTISLDNKYTY